MSTLKADTIVASDGTSPVTLTKQIAPKATANTNNAGTTINESFGVTSLTDSATGQQQLNLTNSMSSANWTGSLALRSVGSTNAFLDTGSSSRADGYSWSQSGGAYSDNHMLWQINGDLA
jgi:hypothetical protein